LKPGAIFEGGKGLEGDARNTWGAPRTLFTQKEGSKCAKKVERGEGGVARDTARPKERPNCS